ncbi:MAG: hypothetical protein B6U73_03680 [Desulfurococcales archaeon ex4484_204]|nr:MAG: hypothetical protein B6U73_03680 [Desulfurococcales archaeon ex4484_204]
MGLIHLLLALVIARLLAYLFNRVDVPAITAYIVTGIVLGPSLLKVLPDTATPEYGVLVWLSLLFLMFYAGLNVDFRGFKEYWKEVILVTTGGVLLTIALVTLTLRILDYSVASSLVVAISVSNTATEVVVVMLEEAGTISDMLKRVLITSSFLDDILAVVMISLLKGGLLASSVEAVTGLGRFAVLFIAVLALSLIAIRLGQRVMYRAVFEWAHLLAFASILFFGLSYLFNACGVSEYLGAYLAGLVISMLRLIHDPTLVYVVRIEEFILRMGTILEFYIIPIFFIYVGAKTSIVAVLSPVAFTVLAVAFIGKLLGSGLPLIAKGDLKKGLVLGLAMNVRGSLEPAVAFVALETGVIDINLFGAVVAVSLLTSALVPVIFSHATSRIEV